MTMCCGRCAMSRQNEKVFVPSLGCLARMSVCESTARRLVLLGTDHCPELAV